VPQSNQRMTSNARFSSDALASFTTALFAAAGMDDEKAGTVARLLVLTDMMGRRTHGLAIAPLYIDEIRAGAMQVTGHPDVLKDTGATLLWDGKYLPGLWLVTRAIDVAMARIAQWGVVTIAISRSHHIGCLAALVKQAADHGFVALIANSDPAGQRVAPYGGSEALFTPDPFAIGYPGSDHPVLVDISASITTVSMARQKYAAGEMFAHPWLLDAVGNPTCDPAVLEHSEPRGSLQLVGGQEYGHKGFGLALMIEALSQGLSGHGRRDAPTRWGGNVFLQVIDPDFFAGRDAFREQTDFLSEKCRANRPIDPERPVRVPGDQAARAIADAAREGVSFDNKTWNAIAGCARELGVVPPQDSRAAG
jgi:LDH2 family malate/lactate/ureidoglycolate dehydrogenase